MSQKAVSNLLSNLEKEEFKSVYSDIVKSLVALNDRLFLNMRTETNWMVTVMEFNVSLERMNETGGERKGRLGYIVPAAYKTLVRKPTKEQIRLAYILGWAVEIFHGTHQIMSGIMDEKTNLKKRNIPCWHSRNGVGMHAINDSLMLRMAHHNIIKMYFGDNEVLHNKLQDLSRQISQNVLCGRMLLEQMRKSLDINASYTMENYRAVVKYERSYYSFYLPIASAILLAGQDENLEDDKFKRILLKIGHLQQLEDDFMSVFECKKFEKLSWFYVRALEKLREIKEYNVLDDLKLESWKHIIFENNFDICDTEIVLEMYLRLKLDDEFVDEYKRTARMIIDEIASLNWYNKEDFGISQFLLGLVSNIL